MEAPIPPHKKTSSVSSTPSTPPQSNSRSPKPWGHGKQILVLIIILVLGIVGYFLFKQILQWAREPKNSNTSSSSTAPTATTTSTQIPVIETPTATPREQRARTCGINDPSTMREFGERFRLFQDDPVYFCRTIGQPGPLRITAKEFTDSRCPKDVQCIWAGEQTVALETANEGIENPSETFTLGTMRHATTSVQGHIITLYGINEEKGGTYAEIQVD